MTTEIATHVSGAGVTSDRDARRRRRSTLRPVWDEQPSIPGRLAKVLVLTVVVLLILFPLYTIVITSLSTHDASVAAGGLVVVPRGLTVGAYRQILSGGVVTASLGVTIFITVIGTALSTVVSVLAAYGLSKPTSFAHRPILFTFLITMFFSAGMIPTYLWVSKLGLINSLWSLILPTAISAFNVLILRSFFMGLDQNILEAARMDGAGEWRILSQLVVPMSSAAIAVVALFYGVGYFNAFFNAMLYINDNSKWPLQLVLRSYVLQGAHLPGGGTAADTHASGASAGLPIKMAIMVLAFVPILLVYPFVQRHFTKGVIFGAIKG